MEVTTELVEAKIRKLYEKGAVITETITGLSGAKIIDEIAVVSTCYLGHPLPENTYKVIVRGVVTDISHRDGYYLYRLLTKLQWDRQARSKEEKAKLKPILDYLND